MSTLASELDEAVLQQDSSRFTHMVNCPDDQPSSAEWVAFARLHNLELTALCGYKWVATSDPIKHPICQECIDVANILIAEVQL